MTTLIMNNEMTLEDELRNFTGSVNFYKIPGNNLVFTEGVKYLVEQANLQPLLNTLEEINNEFPKEFYKFINIKQSLDGTLTVRVNRDDNDLLSLYLVGYYTQVLPFDKEKGFDIWVIDGTILLPSEY